MIKIIAAFLLCASSSFAVTPILEKHAQSGYVIPENSFTKDCRIFENGQLEATIVKGDGTATGFTSVLPKTKMNLIVRLLKSAKKGKIDEYPMPCDVGTTTLKGFIKDTAVEIDVALDCYTRRLNKSTATPHLVALAKDICTF